MSHGALRIPGLTGTCFLGAVAFVLAASPAPAFAHSLWITPVLRECATAVDDTVRFDVMLNHTVSPIDGGVIHVSASSLTRLTFVSAQRGELIPSWENFSATVGPHSFFVAIDLSGTTPLPAGTTGQLVRLTCVTDCCPNGLYDSPRTVYLSGSGDFDFHGVLDGWFQCKRTPPGTISVESGFTNCDGMLDTARVHVRLVNTSGPIDAGGLDILVSGYYGGVLKYVGWERGDLTAAWETWDVTAWPGTYGSRFRVSGGSSTPIPAGTTGTFVTLLYQVNCCSGGGWNYSYIEPGLPTGDLAAYPMQLGAWSCVQVKTRPSTWGAVKALYRQ